MGFESFCAWLAALSRAGNRWRSQLRQTQAKDICAGRRIWLSGGAARMRITGLALVPPPTAADLPKVTPELLASVLARYSRSNEGIGAILAKVDLANPDESIDRILKFVDYGHASIGGLTGGLAVALDDVSMWLAYKIFDVAQMADGQESSTRYITMDAANVPSAAELGIPDDLAPRWRDLLARAFAAYQAEYARLDALATNEPARVRLPADAK